MLKLKINRRKTLLIAAILCCAAILASGTLAYFTAQETAYNVITTGNLRMKLAEETADGKPFPQDGIGNVIPGLTVDKIVYLENIGNVAFYGRISLEKTISGAQDVQLNFDQITLDIDTESWAEKDGFYYYKTSIAPGEKTKPLFTSVHFDSGLDNAYQNAEVKIAVHAQAVQSANNGSTPLAAVGWE